VGEHAAFLLRHACLWPALLLVSVMFSVLMLFLIPVGGGIPAGVLLAQTKGLVWPVTAGLYLVSDVMLALAFEPILKLFAWSAGKVPFLARFSARMKAAKARSVAYFGGTGAGPITLIMISFGADPMTGRASALAAGHGFLMGWAFAIAGDMLYFAVIAVTTLRLNTYFRDPDTTMWVVLGAMIVVPLIIRFFRGPRKIQTRPEIRRG
jgi:hypothetical protein